jgi:hypothetical protein
LRKKSGFLEEQVLSREKKRSLVGVVPLAKRLLLGAPDAPKVRKNNLSVTSNPNADSTTNYESWKPEGYRWFRQDEMVRRCIIINAAFSMMSAGFETELEPTEKVSEEQVPAFREKYRKVKDYVGAVNKAVNLDQALFVAQVKRSIYGKAGFEIVKDCNKPSWLLSVQSTKLEPDVDEKWVLQGFKYEGKETYTTDELLYFTNLQLENDFQGLSDIEPILDVCEARHNLPPSGLSRNHPQPLGTLRPPKSRHLRHDPRMAQRTPTRFELTQNEAKGHFHRCPRCHKYFCEEDWNEQEGLCTEEAPRKHRSRRRPSRKNGHRH